MRLLSSLNELETEKLQKIWDTDYKTILNGKDNGVPFLRYVFELHFKLFGETCSSCPNKISGYVSKIKKLNPDQMSKEIKKSENFQLNQGVILPVPGTSIAYSNANLTDEIAIELLAANPNRKAVFAKLPKDVDKLIAEFKAKTTEAKDAKVVTNTVTIGESNLTVEQALSLLEKVNIKTKANTAKGLKDAIAKLPADVKAELEKLASEVKDAKVLTPARTKEDIQFDLEKAILDLEELESNPTPDQEAIAAAKENVAKFELELNS